MSPSIDEGRVKRKYLIGKEPSMGVKIARVTLSFLLIINLILLVLHVSPSHIKEPIQQKVRKVINGESSSSMKNEQQQQQDSSSSNTNNNNQQSSSFSSTSSTDETTVISSLQIQFSHCNQELLQKYNNPEKYICSSPERLKNLGFSAAIQTCSNFEELRERNSEDSSSSSFCRSTYLSSSSQQGTTTINYNKVAMKRFVSEHAMLFSLNISTPIHYENMVTHQIVTPSSPTSKTKTQANSSSSSSSSFTNKIPSNITATIAKDDESTTTAMKMMMVPNSTLSTILNNLKSMVSSLKKQKDFRLTKETRIDSKKKRSLSSIFVYAISELFHNSFEGRRVLVWSSLKLPTIEVACFALAQAREIDVVNVVVSNYKTSVPSFRTFQSPEEFYEEAMTRKNNHNNKKLKKYGVIVSYMTLQYLGLASEKFFQQEQQDPHQQQGNTNKKIIRQIIQKSSSSSSPYLTRTLDPFADFHQMNEFWKLLKPGGLLILTIPVGADCLDFNRRRIYGKERLSLLVRGWTIELAVGISTNKETILEGRKPCGEDDVAVSEALIVLRRAEPSDGIVGHDEELNRLF